MANAANYGKSCQAKNANRYTLDGSKMTDAAVGGRVKALAKERGVSIPLLATGLGIDQSVLYRLLRGDMKWTVEYLTKAASVLGTTPAAFFASPEAGGASGSSPGLDAGPIPDGGLWPALPVDPELANDPKYWRGRQEEAASNMQWSAASMRLTMAMHDRALATQRDLLTHTRPIPLSQLEAGLTEQERDFLAIMRQGGEELRARLERQAREALEQRTPPPAKKSGRRASGE